MLLQVSIFSVLVTTASTTRLEVRISYLIEIVAECFKINSRGVEKRFDRYLCINETSTSKGHQLGNRGTVVRDSKALAFLHRAKHGITTIAKLSLANFFIHNSRVAHSAIRTESLGSKATTKSLGVNMFRLYFGSSFFVPNLIRFNIVGFLLFSCTVLVQERFLHYISPSSERRKIQLLIFLLARFSNSPTT